jgi:small GTP-binding protein
MRLIQKKVCLLGEFAVGKTSLVRRYVEGSFDDKYLSTIGVKVSRKLLAREDCRVNLVIWDLAGGEDFSGHDHNYLRGLSGAVLTFDLTRPETLGILSQYAEQVHEINPEAALVIAANKFDLVTESNIPRSGLDIFCRSNDSQFLYTSAKTGENVERLIDLLADRMISEE